jgi:transposase, IS30 family
MPRRRVAYGEREEFFELVCSGLSLKRAAELSGVSENAGREWWRRSGAMNLIRLGAVGGLVGSAPARVPGMLGPGEPPRKRRPLTSEDRSAIAVGLMCGCSYARIGVMIGRDKSVICREVARNRGPDGSYWGPVAHRAAHERRRRPKATRLAQNPGLCRWIEDRMDEGWSPKLIAQVLRRDDPCVSMNRVGHETIYQSLYVQTRGELRKDLYRRLSLKRRQRKPRGQAERRGTSLYAEAFTIRDRPAEAADRAVPGHWEGDLILGTGNGSAIGTLVERSTRFTILLHLPGRHDADTVAEAMIREMGNLPEHLRRSITWDRGTELADFERIQLELGTKVFFCDPHSPWQRGTNENTNRLLRFWLEKGTDLSIHTAADLRRIADTLNRRPRPTLDLQTPADRLAALLTNPAAA